MIKKVDITPSKEVNIVSVWAKLAEIRPSRRLEKGFQKNPDVSGSALIFLWQVSFCPGLSVNKILAMMEENVKISIVGMQESADGDAVESCIYPIWIIYWTRIIRLRH